MFKNNIAWINSIFFIDLLELIMFYLKYKTIEKVIYVSN